MQRSHQCELTSQVLVLGGKAAPQRRAGAATAHRRPSGKRGRFFDHYSDGAGTLVGTVGFSITQRLKACG